MYNGGLLTRGSREVIAQFPSGVIALRLNASQEGALNVDVALARTRGILWQGASLDNNTVTMDVGGDDAGSIAFSSGVRVVADGSKFKHDVYRQNVD